MRASRGGDRRRGLAPLRPLRQDVPLEQCSEELLRVVRACADRRPARHPSAVDPLLAQSSRRILGAHPGHGELGAKKRGRHTPAAARETRHLSVGWGVRPLRPALCAQWPEGGGAFSPHVRVVGARRAIGGGRGAVVLSAAESKTWVSTLCVFVARGSELGICSKVCATHRVVKRLVMLGLVRGYRLNDPSFGNPPHVAENIVCPGLMPPCSGAEVPNLDLPCTVCGAHRVPHTSAPGAMLSWRTHGYITVAPRRHSRGWHVAVRRTLGCVRGVAPGDLHRIPKLDQPDFD